MVGLIGKKSHAQCNLSWSNTLLKTEVCSPVSPLSCLHLWHVFIVVAMASSLYSLRWCCCCSCACVSILIALALSLLSRWCCCRSCAGVVALIALVSSPLASLPLLRQRFHRHCTGAVDIVPLASLLWVYGRACWRLLLGEGDNVIMLVVGLTANVRIFLATFGGGGGRPS